MTERCFVFLWDEEETPGERVARCAREALADGPMGCHLRRESYVAFLDRVRGRGSQLSYVRTSCAVFAGSVLGYAGHRLKSPWRADGTWGITTWLNLHLRGRGWTDARPGTPVPVGAVFYREYGLNTAGTAGHVGVVVEETPDGWVTAEGGGSPRIEDVHGLSPAKIRATNGTVCRLSDPKDIWARDSMGRRLLGWWDPAELNLSRNIKDMP